MNDVIIGIKDLSNVIIPEIGKIKIGKKGEERTSSKGNKYKLPEKLDHFLITTLERNEDGNYKADNIMKSLGNSPTELNIKVLHDDINSVFPHWYSYYQGDNLVCKGDGVNCIFYGYSGDQTPQRKNCPGEKCVFREKNYCKPNGIFSCTFHGQERIGCAYKFRTSSWNSIQGILSSLKFIKSLSGGVLAELPLKMVLKPKTTTYESKGKTGVTTIQVVHIEFDGSIEDLQRAAVEIKKRRKQIQDDLDSINIDVFKEELTFSEEDKEDGEVTFQDKALNNLSEKEEVEQEQKQTDPVEESNITIDNAVVPFGDHRGELLKDQNQALLEWIADNYDKDPSTQSMARRILDSQSA